MKKYNKRKVREELIRRYYCGDYDQSISRELFDEFGSILMERQGQEERRAIFEKLWNEESGTISDERRSEVLKKIIARIEREDGFVLGGIEKIAASKRSLGKRLLRVAAVVVPAMILVGGVWMLSRGEGQAVDQGVREVTTELVAHKGETKDTILPDSSKVWVNSGSKVVFRVDSSDRRLANLDGECYFEVAKDEQRQFVVETKGLTVTVLGTKFNIEAYSDRRLTIVTLDQGSLRVALLSGAEYMITPGQQLVYDNDMDAVEVINMVESDEYMMSKWREGNQICYRMTLGEIFNAIERKYNYKITITDSTSLKSDRTYNAVFADRDSPDDILQVIRFMSGEGFNYSVHGEEVIIQ